MFYQHFKGAVEALLFASGNPLSASHIADILGIAEEHTVVLLEQLRQDMDDDSRGIMLTEVAGGYQLCTKPELSETVSRLVKAQESRLSMPALETLAIVAFKQPITRQEIESIRGVSADGVLNTLLERGLIREMGRKEAIGRPILYGTTDAFLECLGLKSLADLPPLPDYMVSNEQA